MMCHSIGLPPISTIGLGRTAVSSLSREPKPPARITAFTATQVIRGPARACVDEPPACWRQRPRACPRTDDSRPGTDRGRARARAKGASPAERPGGRACSARCTVVPLTVHGCRAWTTNDPTGGIADDAAHRLQEVPLARQRRGSGGRGRDRHGVCGRGQSVGRGLAHSDHRADLRQAQLRRSVIHRQLEPFPVRRFRQQRDHVPVDRCSSLLLRGRPRQSADGAARQGGSGHQGMPGMHQRDPIGRATLSALHGADRRGRDRVGRRATRSKRPGPPTARAGPAMVATSAQGLRERRRAPPLGSLAGMSRGGPYALELPMGQAELVCVVEIPKGGRNKYEYDPELDGIKFDRLLISAATYPTDYVYLRGTLAPDGDPLDALVCLYEPTFPGCLIPVKPLGMFKMHDEKGRDDKIICVPLHDPYWNAYETLE